MKISYNWLKEYLPTDLAPQRTAEILTATGLEVESVEKVEKIKGSLAGVVIGEVITCAQHPNADRLRLTTVNLGGESPLQIVCGAPNVAAGQKVLVATIGTTLYPSSGEPLTIKKGKIRGEESWGMICAEDELGLGSSHDGILVMPAGAVVGSPASDYFDVSEDHCLEIGLTPNRTDAFSHFGVARDLYAALRNTYTHDQPDVKLVQPDITPFEKIRPAKNIVVDVKVEDADACPRYCGLTISHVKVGPSPSWLTHRLLAIGLRPINNIVDITNFVQHEIGQPLHAFDVEKMSGKKVVVRKARQGEVLITLDGVERKTDPGDLMICDSDKPMCFAGIFGGRDSGVTETTTTIFLESALFNPINVRKSARKQGLNTDSSFRFERGCDPEITDWALRRAALLITELAGGVIESDVVDISKEKFQRKQVQYRWEKTSAFVGTTISPEKVEGILQDLDFEIAQRTDDGIIVKVPGARNEVTREVDVVEEVLRIFGYDNVPFPGSLRSSLSNAPSPDPEKVLQSSSDFLSSLGFHEMMAMSLSKQKYLDLLDGEEIKKEAVLLINPLSSDLSLMRMNLLFGGLESIAMNQNHKHVDLRLYEVGKTYKKTNEGYHEELHMSLFMSGRKYPENWNNSNENLSFYEMHDTVYSLLQLLGITHLESVPVPSPYLNRNVEIRGGKVALGACGLVSDALLKKFDIDRPVIHADLNWDEVIRLIPRKKLQYSAPNKFPSVRRDLSLLLDHEVTFDQLEQAAKSVDKSILRSVGLFDVYEGKNLPQGKKSYALSFILQDKNKTLKDEQIDQVMNKITRLLAEKFNAELRS